MFLGCDWNERACESKDCSHQEDQCKETRSQSNGLDDEQEEGMHLTQMRCDCRGLTYLFIQTAKK